MKASAKREFRGGAYGELEGEAITSYQKHHVPADAISPLSRYKGGAIQVTPEDHKLTGSWGSSSSAKTYRAKQKELIDAGDFKGAFEMDVNDIRSKFGSKYDKAIEEARQYYIKEGMIKE